MTKVLSGEPGEVSRNISLTAIGNLAFPLAAFVTAPLLAWQLGADGRGELAAAIAPLMLLVSVAALGMPESLSYYTASRLLPFKKSLPRVLGVLWCAGLLAVCGTWLAAPALAAGNHEVTVLIMVAVTALPLSLSAAAFRGVAIGLHEWNRVNAEKYITAASRFLVIVGAALTDNLSLPVAVGIMAYSPVLGCFAYIGLKDYSHVVPVQGISPKRPMRLLFSYSINVWVGAMSGVLLMRMDQLLMLPIAGAVQLGLYAVAVNVAELMLVVNNAVRDVMFSADAANRDDERLYKAARMSLLITTVIALPTALIAPFWFPLIFGSDFTEALPAVLVLIVAVVIGVPGSVAGSALSARGRPGLRSRSLIIASVVNLLALVVLLPALGALGAAYATLLGNLVSSNLNIWWLSKYFNVSGWGFYRVNRSDLLSMKKQLQKMVKKGSNEDQPQAKNGKVSGRDGR